MVNKATGEPMVDRSAPFVPRAPQVMPDTPGYQSPIDGTWIEGRRARRYDLESNNCVEAGDRPTMHSRDGWKNKRFADKWGLKDD